MDEKLVVAAQLAQLALSTCGLNPKCPPQSLNKRHYVEDIIMASTLYVVHYTFKVASIWDCGALLITRANSTQGKDPRVVAALSQ